MSRAGEIESDVPFLRSRFYVDGTSRSGLRMSVDNGARNPTVIRKRGDVAGYITRDARGAPRWEVGIRHTVLKVSRIIFTIVNGPIPPGSFVDHKDGNPLNNDISNLQLLTNSENLRALTGPYSCNTSGFLGVFRRPNNSWAACIRRNGHLHYLGTFSCPKRAARAYNEAVIRWAKEHGEKPRYLNPV